jgi:D-alanine-D-alanine ligase
MRWALTYDLKDDYRALGLSAEQVAEFDDETTIAALAGVLEKAGHEVTRVGSARALTKRLATGERWDFVFNIAEGAFGSARESQVPALLDVFGIDYTGADALSLAVCLDKRLAKHVVREHGVPTANSAVVETLADLERLVLPFPVFAKPIAEGSSRGVTGASINRDLESLQRCCAMLLEAYRQPVLVEAYLSGREFTVGVLGTGARARTLGPLEVVLSEAAEAGVYSYENKQRWQGRVSYVLATDDEAKRAEQVALQAHRALGCRDVSRIDIRSDAEGNPHFIEANALPGLSPVYSDLAILARFVGLDYDELISAIVESALLRKTDTSDASRPRNAAVHG